MVTVITHGDADGVCSAAIVKSRYPDCKIVISRPTALHRELNDVLDEDLVFVCDIGINLARKTQIMSSIKKLGKKLIYIDHHRPRLNRKIYSTRKAASQLTYEYLYKDVPKQMYWISVFGCIADRIENKFVEKAYNSWSKDTIYFEATTLSLAIECSRNWFKKILIEELSKGLFPSDIPAVIRKAKRAVEIERNIRAYTRAYVEKKGRVAYIVDPPGRGFTGTAAVFARSAGKSPIGLCARNVQGSIDISIRSEKINLTKLVEKASIRVGGSGGGHPKAAGATIPCEKLKEFIEELNRGIHGR